MKLDEQSLYKVKLPSVSNYMMTDTLIMGPGGYKVTDFMKGGGIMTILFLVVSLAVMNCLF